ncbi:phage tail tape measure protein [Schaalia vaccimaxillae]|uniref:phage tail tape measure protein n=1 Tax=Schaalia vaccimaxillae TaxID=183916 RepID=UPI0003B4A19A|nr:phage tail tape measure protein [Schaalia vaccimaxillae]
MAGKSAILSVRIIGDATNAVKAMDSTGNASEGLIGKIGGMVPSMAMIGTAAVGAAVAAGKALYDIGAQFDDMADTIRVGTGASGEALDGLVGSAKNIATQIPASLDQIGPAVADVNTRLGLTGKTLETVASQYLEAGRILGEEIDIQSTSAALTQFKISGDEVSGGLDTLFRVSQGTGVSINSLADSLGKQGPALQELGFNFETSAALVGVLDKAGLDADKTLGGLGKSLVTLAKQGEEPQDAFKRVTGELGDLLASGDRAAAIDLASTLFGTKGATQFIGALDSGALSMDTLASVAQGTGDTILGVGAETMDAAEKFEIMKNKAMVALEPVASAIFDGVGQAMDWLLGLVDSFDMGKFLEAYPWVANLATGIKDFATSIAGFLGPIIQGIAPIVLDAVTLIGTYLGDMFNFFSQIFTFVGQLITGDWSGAWDTMGNIVSSARTLIVNLVSGLGNLVGGAISSAINWAKDTWNNGWSSISNLVKTKASEIISNVTSGLAALPGKMLQAGKDAIQGFINGIGSMGSSLWNAASNMAGNAVDAIKSKLGIHSPSRVGIGLGRFFGQGVALGIMGEAGRVNAAGRTLVSPLAALDVALPAPSTNANGARAAQVVNHFEIHGVLDADDAARKISKILETHDRRTGMVTIGGGA